MPFELKDIQGVDFRRLNDFFLNGSPGNQLVEESQSISHSGVDLRFNEWYFDGIRMGFSDWRYERPVALKWSYDIRVELVSFMANLKGSVLVSDQSDQAQQILGKNQHNLFYSNGPGSDYGILRCDGSHASMFFIQFTKDAFLRLTQGANESLNRFGENVLKGNPALLSSDHLPITAPMQNMIGNIVNCHYKDGLKKMYLLSKAIEFLVIQAEASNSNSLTSRQYIKSAYDRDCILHARDYVLDHLDEPPGLSQLSRIVGINEYKLKRGFKEIFGNTVFGYISDARLEIAKNDLLEKKKTAGQIAMELGYSSPQHFSNAFKKKFGFAPSKLRR